MTEQILSMPFSCIRKKIYDEESGDEKIRVENESEIQMYLDNPDFDIKL